MFPDIVCKLESESKIGVEVKSTKADKWECLGNSINESSRINGIQRIYVFFGKLGGIPKMRYAKYQDVIQTIKITHFPRYHLKMDMEKMDNIFLKMKTDYDTFRNNEQKYKTLRQYYRANLKDGEELWWIDDHDNNGSIVKLWSDMRAEEKKEILSEALVLFTEIFSTHNQKYNRVTPWLVSKYQVVSPSLRDSFSAGGKVNINGHSFPKVVGTLMEHIDRIIGKINSIPLDDIAHYWKMEIDNFSKKDRFMMWLSKIMKNISLNPNVGQEGCEKLKRRILMLYQK